MKNKILTIILALLTVTFAGCISESNCGYNSGGDPEIVLSLKVPGSFSSATRTLSDGDEVCIETLDVLVFKDNGSDPDTYLYRTHATKITDGAEPNIKNYKVMLQQSKDGYELHRIVLLANLRSEIDAVHDEFTESHTFEQILQKIKFDSSEEWNVGDDFRPLPMYGMSKASYVITPNINGSHIQTIDMIRALARIDIGLNIVETAETGNDDLSDVFQVSDIKVYNTSMQGYAAPAQVALNADRKKVSLPTVPVGVRNPEPLHYVFDMLNEAGEAADNRGLVKGIYIAESDNINASHSEMVCALIGGYYTEPGQTKNSDNKTWYRLDFLGKVNEDGDTGIIDILRNHKYVINITAVDGPGYPDEETALNSLPFNMDSEVIAWDDADMTEVTFDDHYFLSVSQKEFRIGKRAKPENILYVSTDYPTGWTHAIRTGVHPDSDELPDNAWIKCVRADNAAGERKEYVFSVDENEKSAPREAYIHLKAGRLNCIIKVVQGNADILSMKVTPEYEVLFPSGKDLNPLVPKTVTVEWEPVDVPVKVTHTAIDHGGLKFVSALPAELTGGYAEFEIEVQPMNNTAINNNEVWISRLDFELESESGMVMRTIYLRQKHSGVSFSYNSIYCDDAYVLLGKEASVTIYSSSAWTATLESTGGTAITGLKVASGVGNTGGEQLTFMMRNGSPSDYKDSAIIRVSSVDGVFPDLLIDIDAYYGYYLLLNGNKRLVAPYDLNSKKSYNEAEAHIKVEMTSDWYLPDIWELDSVYRWAITINNGLIDHGFNTSGGYWSSTKWEAGDSEMFFYDMHKGNKEYAPKSSAKHVRAIRMID